jgi:hypothetical protein
MKKKIKVRNLYGILLGGIFFVVSLFVFARSVHAEMINIRLCASGAPQEGWPQGWGVARFRDSGDRKRYLEMGSAEKPDDPVVYHSDDTYTCALFYSWQGLGEHGRRTLYNNTINVPTVGVARRASISEDNNRTIKSEIVGGDGYGCGEKPHHYTILSNDYSCTEAAFDGFDNDGADKTRTFWVTCTRKNNPPTVSVDKPTSCNSASNVQDSFDYNIVATDTDVGGGSNIDKMKLDIGGNIFVINLSGGVAASLENPIINIPGGTLTAAIQNGLCGTSACRSGNSVTVKVRVNGYNYLCNSVRVKAWAHDTGGAESAWFDGGVFTAGDISDPNFAIDHTSGNTVYFRWTLSSSCSNLFYTSYQIFVCSDEFGNNCQPCFPLKNSVPQTSTTDSCSVSGNPGDYYFKLVTTNGCGSSPKMISKSLGNAWLMTGWGDAYASQGYGNPPMTIQSKTPKSTYPQRINDFIAGIPQGVNAFFSTYLIGSGNTSIMSSKESSIPYSLLTYTDLNGSKNWYTFLSELRNINNSPVCSYPSAPLTLSGTCNGKKIYFVSDTTLTFTDNFIEDVDSACVFIVNNSNIIIGSNVTEIDGFFILDGTSVFQTQSANPDTIPFVVKGSVITKAEPIWNRVLLGFENNDNPSEVIRYDSRYLDLLRECLGEGYPIKIREYSYSSSQ